MGRILEAFAGDELHVIPPKEIRSPEHQKPCNKVCELQERLKEKLNTMRKWIQDEQMFAMV